MYQALSLFGTLMVTMKLIRWRIVVHGGIDVFSRLVVFLGCATNNTAATVLRRFHTAVQKYGLPSRVRSDVEEGKIHKLHCICSNIHLEGLAEEA